MNSAVACADGARRQTRSLLDDYRPGDFFFAAPDATLLARGAYARIAIHGGVDALHVRVGKALAGAQSDGVTAPIVVGALPFAPHTRGWLLIPEEVRWGPPLAAGALPAAAPPPFSGGGHGSSGDWRVRETPSLRGYEAAVRLALTRIAAGELQKVVLARTLELRHGHAIDPVSALHAVAAGQARGYTFAADLPAVHGGARRTLIGASPELLLARSGRRVVSHPLAGSIPRAADCTEDHRRASTLAGSGKDLHEHELLVQAVAEALAPHCVELNVPARPGLMDTPTVWHLGTRIEGRLRSQAPSALALAQALHPTPAVCGVPMAAAAAAIDSLEPFDRGYYAGAVGWSDAAGDGRWALTIRCAEISGAGIRLAAGAGIVAGSEPRTELDETTAKLRTMLRALGLEQLLGGDADGGSEPATRPPLPTH